MQKISVIGNVGKDAEVKQVAGKDLIVFSVATVEKWKSPDGQSQSKTTWHEVEIWRQAGKSGLVSYVKKGGLIYIEGKAKVDAYVNKSGEAVGKLVIVANDVQLLSSSQNTQNTQNAQSSVNNNLNSNQNGSEEEAPF